jgi:hypothetical protein
MEMQALLPVLGLVVPLVELKENCLSLLGSVVVASPVQFRKTLADMLVSTVLYPKTFT